MLHGTEWSVHLQRMGTLYRMWGFISEIEISGAINRLQTMTSVC